MKTVNGDLRKRRHKVLSGLATANDPQPFRCVKCGEAVSHVNPRPCACLHDKKEPE